MNSQRAYRQGHTEYAESHYQHLSVPTKYGACNGKKLFVKFSKNTELKQTATTTHMISFSKFLPDMATDYDITCGVEQIGTEITYWHNS